MLVGKRGDTVGDVMFVAVLIALTVLGGAAWSAQSYSTAHNRARSHRVTGVLLGCSTLILVAATVSAVVTAL
jgi:hypothetical protein